MLLLMCYVGASRYAIDSRVANSVLPRVRLQPVAGAPPWLAGLLIYRGTATPVLDLLQLTEGMAGPPRLSSRIVMVEVEVEATIRQFGILVERVGLRELHVASDAIDGEAVGLAAFGQLCLDDQGVYQLVDVRRLIAGDRHAILFSAAGTSV